MEIVYLPVYHPSKEEIANPELYAQNVRKLMAECLGVPTTNHTIADAMDKKEPARITITNLFKPQQVEAQ